MYWPENLVDIDSQGMSGRRANAVATDTMK